ncbi:hypothetical protein [Edwardsiella ictaluri]|uniref:hypothetical protein n=1 Tax=Edwardsiella ictaluri TaxID=67780 RepID=UPI00241623F0|nr:hypothetical protein [Edwardsiella ictaluri]WFO11799.1 hypothetical protein MAY82_10950 [Edwardsiella ictaluri]
MAPLPPPAITVLPDARTGILPATRDDHAACLHDWREPPQPDDAGRALTPFSVGRRPTTSTEGV